MLNPPGMFDSGDAESHTVPKRYPAGNRERRKIITHLWLFAYCLILCHIGYLDYIRNLGIFLAFSRIAWQRNSRLPGISREKWSAAIMHPALVRNRPETDRAMQFFLLRVVSQSSRNANQILLHYVPMMAARPVWEKINPPTGTYKRQRTCHAAHISVNLARNPQTCVED